MQADAGLGQTLLGAGDVLGGEVLALTGQDGLILACRLGVATTVITLVGFEEGPLGLGTEGEGDEVEFCKEFEAG